MKLKRLLATALVFALVLTMGTAAMAADISTYSDLPSKDSWNYEAIVSAIENNVITGENGFIRPGEYITVGQMYTYTGNALGVSLGTPVNSTATATREDLFVLLAEVVGAELSSLDSVDTYLKGFGDYASISTSARTPIAALIKAGYINGVKSGLTASLYPKNQLSRSEYAVLAHRIFGKYVNSPGTINGDINGNITVRSSGVTISGNIVSGDLIIGGTSGTVDVNLSGSTIRGRTIVRGNASITANSRSTVGIVHSYADLTFSGDATTINVRGKGSNTKLNGGWLRNLNLESDNNTVSVSTGTDVAFCSVDGSGNSVNGTGTVGNASVGGSNNKFEIAGANVSDTGRNNTASTKTGTFNITGVEITGNTTILVTFDAKIQTAPASAFTLSGTAKSYANSATPNSTSVSGSTVTLTFNSATFYSITNPNNSATIAATDAVISSEKAKLNIKSYTGGTDSGNNYDQLVNFSMQTKAKDGGATLTQDGNNISIDFTRKNINDNGFASELSIKFTVNDAMYMDIDTDTYGSKGNQIDGDVTIEKDTYTSGSGNSKYTLYDLEASNSGAYHTNTSNGKNAYVDSYVAGITIDISDIDEDVKDSYKFALIFYRVDKNGSATKTKQTYNFTINIPK